MLNLDCRVIHLGTISMFCCTMLIGSIAVAPAVGLRRATPDTPETVYRMATAVNHISAMHVHYAYSVAGKTVYTLEMTLYGSSAVTASLKTGTTNIIVKGCERSVFIYCADNPSRCFIASEHPHESLWNLTERCLANLVPSSAFRSLLSQKSPVPESMSVSSIKRTRTKFVLTCTPSPPSGRQVSKVISTLQHRYPTMSQEELSNILEAATAPFEMIIDSRTFLPVESKFAFTMGSGRSIKQLFVIERYQFKPFIGTPPAGGITPGASFQTTSLSYFHNLVERGLNSF